VEAKVPARERRFGFVLGAMIVPAALQANPVETAAPMPVPYAGQLVFEGPSVPGWRFYIANAAFAEGPQPAYSAVLDDGQKPLAVVSVYSAGDKASRDRLLAERMRLDLEHHPADETIVTDSPEGKLAITFVRRRTMDSKLYLSSKEGGAAWSFCTIQLEPERKNWISSMPLAIDGCRTWFSQVEALAQARSKSFRPESR
jgi:hypothetical protein